MAVTREQTALYWRLDRLGRVWLSPRFQMRQFLYSEIAAAFGIVNYPDDPELAVETGTLLATEILEPLVAEFGPIILRSGFRSARLNTFGAANRMQCASNERNHAYHIWDHRDANGHKGAAACVVIPGINADPDPAGARARLIAFIKDNLDFHRLTFFARDNAFNIGWHERPRREIRDVAKRSGRSD